MNGGVGIDSLLFWPFFHVECRGGTWGMLGGARMLRN